MIVGENGYRYEWLDNWGQLPPGMQWGFTHGVVTDAQDRVYIFNQSPQAMVVLDRDGEFITSWGERFAAGAHGLLLSREDGREFLWLADYELQAVVKTTLEGEVVLELDAPARPDIYGPDRRYKPTFACTAPDGRIFVFDGYGQSWVHQYDRNGRYISSFGGKGSEPGRLNCPHAGYVDLRSGQPLLYVADRGNNRIQKFTLEGEPLGFVTDEMDMPCMFFEHGGDLYIPDLHSRLTILDRQDRLIAHLGWNPEAWQTKGWPNIQETLRPGRFNSPHACCVDSSGDVYLVEWISTGRVTKLRKV